MRTNPESETRVKGSSAVRVASKLHAGEDHASILTMPTSGKPNAVVLPNVMRDEEVEGKDISTSFVRFSTPNGVTNIARQPEVFCRPCM